MVFRLQLFALIFMVNSVSVTGHGQDSPGADPEPKTDHPGDAFSPSGHWTGPLLLPEVVRFRLLPMRMYLEPLLFAPPTIPVFKPEMIPFFSRRLQEDNDAEIQEAAALSLARIAREKLGDIGPAVDSLKSASGNTTNDDVRRACFYALAEGDVTDAAGELFKQSLRGSDTDRMVIDPALARWKWSRAADTWRARLSRPAETVTSVRLACECLTEIGDQQSTEALSSAVRNFSMEAPKRMAAATALCRLNPETAFSQASSLIKGSVPNRFVALALLNQQSTQSYQLTEILCDDVSDGVAAAAWQQLLQLSPENLVSRLAAGRIHRDASVRMTSARVMQKYPSPERALWLNEMLSDRHIDVRNTARRMLVETASAAPELRDGIVDQAATALRLESKDWQGIEQSLVLLGQLQATQFSPACVALLNYPRSEVSISAAWLIHLYPDASIKAPILQQIAEIDAQLQVDDVDPDPGNKQTYLFQYCGILRYSEIEAILEKQYVKGAPGGGDMRGAAMWAIGLLHERNPDPAVVAKLEDRVNDRNPLFPEADQVRRMALLALGIMRAKSAAPSVQNSYVVDTRSTLIPGTARWVLPLLGEPMPEDFEPWRQNISGWKLMPSGYR